MSAIQHRWLSLMRLGRFTSPHLWQPTSSLRHPRWSGMSSNARPLSTQIRPESSAHLSTTASSPTSEGIKGRLPEIHRKSQAKWTLFWAVPICTTFALGTWQYSRMHEKLQMVEDRKKSLDMDPIPLNDITNTYEQMEVILSSDMQYRRVSVRGSLLYDLTVLVRPKPAPASVPQRVLTWGGSSGAYVLTPFRLETPRNKEYDVIWVNRGWIPARMQAMDRATWDVMAKDPKQVVEIQGVLRNSDRTNSFTPDNVVEKDDWYWVDRHALTQLLDPSAKHDLLLLDAFQIHPIGGSPSPPLSDKQPMDELLASAPYLKNVDQCLKFPTNVQTHIEYAFTWYTLCAVLIAYASFMRKRQVYKPVALRK